MIFQNSQLKSLLLIFIFILIILGIFYPKYINKDYIGRGSVDQYLHIWDFWWAKKSLVDLGGNFFFCDYVNYPGGVNIWNGNSGFLLAFFTVPIQVIFNNQILTYNLTVLFSVFFTFLGGYLLSLYLLKSRMLSFFAGTAFSLNPFILNQIKYGFLEFVNLGIALLFILYLMKFFDKKDMRNCLLGCVWFMIATFWSLYVGYMLSLFTIIFVLFNVNTLRRGFEKEFLYKVIIGGVILGSFMFLLSTYLTSSIYPTSMVKMDKKFLSNTSKVVIPEEDPENFKIFPTDDTKEYLGEWLVLKLLHSTDLKRFFTFNNPYYYKGMFFISGWIILIIFGLLGIIRCQFKYKKSLIFSIIIFFLLSLGICFKFNSKIYIQTYKYMPYFWFSKIIPGFHRVQFPVRFLILPIIFSIIFSGYGLKELLDRFKISGFRRKLTVLNLTVIILVTFMYPFNYPIPYFNIKTPEIYKKLSNDTNDYAIIEIPFSINEKLSGKLLDKSPLYSYYQTIHEKRRLSSHFPIYLCKRKYPEAIKDNPLLKILEEGSGKSKDKNLKKLDRKKIKASLRKLKKYRFKYIFLHSSSENYEKLKKILDNIFESSQAYSGIQNEKIVVYE